MTSYLINALPGACIPKQGGRLDFRPIEPAAVPESAVSAIGHVDTAKVIGGFLGREVLMNRVSVPEFVPGDVHYLALYRGPRLPEGSTVLPAGSEIKFYRMEVKEIE